MIYLDENFKDDVFSTRAKSVTDFENALSEQVFAGQSVVCTNTGTAALKLALWQAHLEPGDKVVIPATTYIATANAVCHYGATPIFVDVDPVTWCLDFSKVDLSDKSIKAIIPVDLYGNPAASIPDMDSPKIIIDACESIGAGRGVDHPGQVRCYSFNRNKTLTAGAGGCIVNADDPDFLRYLSQQAMGSDRWGDARYVGGNWRMTGSHAVLGLLHLDALKHAVERRRIFNILYRERLSEFVTFQEPTPNTKPSWWMTAGLLPKRQDKIESTHFQKKMAEKGIPTRRVFEPLVKSDGRGYYGVHQKYPVSENIHDRGICFPSSPLNSIRDIQHVCDGALEILKG